MKEIIIPSIDKIPEAAQLFVEAIGNRKVFLFYGHMGAGKTTFIRAICEALGVEDVINSPTFAIVNEYSTTEGRQVFHFDFYRINKVEEAYDFGCEDYFYSGQLCFVEWPEMIEPLLPADAVEVHISEQEDGSRRVVVG